MREALAAAGYPGAEVARGQTPAGVSACGVGYLHGGGTAQSWATDDAAGLYCQPADERPDFIILQRGAPRTTALR